MGQLIRQQKLRPDAILCSTALRARATADAVARETGFNDVRLYPELYLAPPQVYVSRLQELPDEVGLALVIGHNPGIEELVEGLCHAPRSMPTAAIAHLTLPADEWGELRLDGKATLVRVWRPKELD
jgi:phosphohistidine phosphatase